MFEEFRKGSFVVTVGVKFDQSFERMLPFLSQFIERVGAKVHLVHAVEPWMEHEWVSVYPGEHVYYAATKQLARKSILDAEKKLDHLAEHFPSDVVSTSVNYGNAYEVLEAEAKAIDSPLIIVGAEQRLGDLFSGFSNALALANHARQAVMIVPDSCQEFGDDSKLHLLYADDLNPRSLAALSTSLDFGLGVGDVRFEHYHVSRDSRREIEEASERILEMMNKNEIPYDPAFSFDHLMSKREGAIKAKMTERVGNASLLFESRRCDYLQRVGFGDVSEELVRHLRESDPDLLVFGRHATVHAKPLGLGKMPTRAMLSIAKPIIISPNR